MWSEFWTGGRRGREPLQKEVTSELRFVERDSFFWEADKGMVLARAWWLRAHGQYVQQSAEGLREGRVRMCWGQGLVA